MNLWEDNNVLVTGGAGFIGSHLVEELIRRKAKVRVVDNLENGSLKNLDLCIDNIEFIKGDLTEPRVCRKSVKDMEIVLNLAAKVGGVKFNTEHPGTMFTSNILINTNMLEAARREDVGRYLCVSSACVYPRHCKIPTPESEGFVGEPEDTNLGYGWAKRMAEVQARTYASEFGMKIAIPRPYNAYGPRDHFDSEKTHVIPAIIKRVFSGEDPLVVWGSGEQTRAFVYVTDIIRGMLLCLEKYAVADPVNIGTTEEIRIRDLVNLIIKFSGKNPEIVFDLEKPSGQPRRNADIRKAKEKIGYEPTIFLKKGLNKTINWYTHQKGEFDAP